MLAYYIKYIIKLLCTDQKIREECIYWIYDKQKLFIDGEPVKSFIIKVMKNI